MSNTLERLSDVVIIEGPPGSGKGFLSGNYLKNTPRTQHISTGNQVRGIRSGEIESAYSPTVLACLEARSFLPDTVFGDIVLEEMVRRSEVVDLTLLDGFPHSAGDFEHVQDKLHDAGRRILGAVCLDATVETCVFRMGYRGMRQGEDVRKEAIFAATETEREYYAGRYEYYLATRDEHRGLLASMGLQLAVVDANPDILEEQGRRIVQNNFTQSINNFRTQRS